MCVRALALYRRRGQLDIWAKLSDGENGDVQRGD